MSKNNIPIHEQEITETILKSDLSNASYKLYSSTCRSLSISIFNGELTLNGEDFGAACEAINGCRFYEFHYNLNTDSTQEFLKQLRLKHGNEMSLSEILKNEFGCDEGSVKFKQYCDLIGVEAYLFSF